MAEVRPDRERPERDAGPRPLAPWTGGVLLVGVDGRPGSQRALEAAARLAAARGMRVVVGHVQPLVGPAEPGPCAQAAREDLEVEVLLQAAAVLDPAGVPWSLALAAGDAATGLHALAEETGADLLVIGTRGCGLRAAAHRLVSGSVSRWLVHHERRPVLVVPT